MVGGGPGAFIGAVHRMAMRLEGHYDLAAGAFSSHPDRSRATGAELGVDPGRVYESYQDMARIEGSRPDGIEAVVIVTPNHLHYPMARAFLEAGLHVICDKPLTTSVEEAEALRDLVTASGRLFFITYAYANYPMVSQARSRLRRKLYTVPAGSPLDQMDRSTFRTTSPGAFTRSFMSAVLQVVALNSLPVPARLLRLARS